MAKDRVTSDNYKAVIHPDRVPRGEHERRFNAPTTNEIAAVVVRVNELRLGTSLFRRTMTGLLEFSLQFNSRRTLIWRAPGPRYHQENTIERHRYGGRMVVWEELFLVPELICMFRSVTMTGHIYRDVIFRETAMYACSGRHGC
ncbi:HTH_Tnp_Tc3_2 domain-containing protein [Trichonephila clavipes]|nr:HTH_Tnp_Tc3_2 domain-containing protein [Trichonephila clavipes]